MNERDRRYYVVYSFEDGAPLEAFHTEVRALACARRYNVNAELVYVRRITFAMAGLPLDQLPHDDS